METRYPVNRERFRTVRTKRCVDVHGGSTVLPYTSVILLGKVESDVLEDTGAFVCVPDSEPQAVSAIARIIVTANVKTVNFTLVCFIILPHLNLPTYFIFMKTVQANFFSVFQPYFMFRSAFSAYFTSNSRK